MNRAASRAALILSVAAGTSLLGTASADPAATAQSASAVTAQSAWSRSALKPDASLNDPLVKRGKEVFDARCRA